MQIGFNGRFFKENWRPALQEIEFGRRHGFQAIQFQGKEEGLSPDHLGSEFSAVRDALEEADLTAVMEILVLVDASGHTLSGLTPLEILQANLPAINELPCRCVHWHLAAIKPRDPVLIPKTEACFLPQFVEAVEIARRYGFQFGVEHNEPDLLMFASPQTCTQLLETIPDLSFVWDLNHTIPEHLSAFQALTPRMSMLHVSDTPLPEVNYHLPIGLGSINFAAYFKALQESGFSGPAILEIGGQPKSGGYGRDSDAALIESLAILKRAQSGQ